MPRRLDPYSLQSFALLPLGIPQWHLVGSEDDLVPAAYVREYVELAMQHDDVRLDLIPDAGHFEVIFPFTAAWPAVRPAVLTLVREAEAAQQEAGQTI